MIYVWRIYHCYHTPEELQLFISLFSAFYSDLEIRRIDLPSIINIHLHLHLHLPWPKFDHHTHMWFFCKLLLQSWNQITVLSAVALQFPALKLRSANCPSSLFAQHQCLTSIIAPEWKNPHNHTLNVGEKHHHNREGYFICKGGLNVEWDVQKVHTVWVW